MCNTILFKRRGSVLNRKMGNFENGIKLFEINEQREEKVFTKIDKQVCQSKILTIDKHSGEQAGRNTWNCSHTSLSSKSAIAIC